MVFKIKNARISFCQNLFVAGLMKNSKPGDIPKFGSTFLIPKNDPQLEELKKVIEAVANEKWKDKGPIVLKALLAEGKVCLKDGDLKPEYDGYDGMMFIQATSKTLPLVINRDRSQLTAADGIPYGGCYVNASIDVWPQDNGFGKRINAQLKGVQFVKDGDAFSGSAPASPDDFSDVSDTGESTENSENLW